MIELKPFRRQDAKEIVKWIRDEEEFRLWSGNTFKVYPIQWKDLADHYENLSKDGTCIPMCAWDQDGIFGHFFLKYLDHEKKHMRIGFIIVDDYCRGLGYGKAMVQKAKAQRIKQPIHTLSIRLHGTDGTIRINNSQEA